MCNCSLKEKKRGKKKWVKGLDNSGNIEATSFDNPSPFDEMAKDGEVAPSFQPL
jgi:hypothetical protein